MMQCLKCQKKYIPKRLGGLFCSVSCGNSYRQQLKRDEQKKAKLVEQGLAVEKEVTDEEVFIWSVLFVLGIEAKKLLLDNNLPADKKPTDIAIRTLKLITDCRDKGESAIMKSLGIRIEEYNKAKKAQEEQNKSKQQKQIVAK
ncbi:MAG: hypothetical protein M3R72_01260 [Bacteroidota bacterium]|nr:hypothetical protein [Bacteroidota bacterium]